MSIIYKDFLTSKLAAIIIDLRKTIMALPTPTQEQPFRFLSLPKELRLKVYERIPLTTRHHTLYDPTFSHTSDTPSSPKPCVALVTKSLEISILLVNRKIHYEALHCLADRLIYLHTQPLRFIVDSLSLNTFIGCSEGNLMTHVREHCLSPGPIRPKSQPQPHQTQVYNQPVPHPPQEPLWYKLGNASTRHIFLSPTTEHALIEAFVAHCAAYITTRRPKGLVVAVRKHNGETVEQSVKTIFDAFCWSEIFVKVELLELGIEECAWIPWGFGGSGDENGGEKERGVEKKKDEGRHRTSARFDMVEWKEKRERKENMSRMKLGQRNVSVASTSWQEGES
ncbi:hypothetical protein T440DRAFT_269507 [Plenodomus tracheiphilus IPT5]|uniref:F-box domain-containing protein n=1 Tax=Plenodomus tracheiphilus IPT5 TaxID=1408161 RepID=A0A6A7BJ71_9PLEO|nr:hypothetical protein T440DRAFT_269507 [Plenodomus tracheiphilus IPT5]